MLRFLFPRLTAAPALGTRLFATVTAEARSPRWYVEGEVPDTLDGRFAMLATITALAMVRLDRAGDTAASVALTERFVEAMKAEHRELGLGDPKLGRTVLELVGALERRVGSWRETVAGGDWAAAVRSSVYRNEDIAAEAIEHTTAALRNLWASLARLTPADLEQGRLA
jgi:cytochrome b pre-mRNA-processing protein 3